MQTQATPPSRIDSGLQLQIHEIIGELAFVPPVERRRWFPPRPVVVRPCDGCGVSDPTVDLWSENVETGEQLWFCAACGG